MRLQEYVPLAPRTTLGVGGTARFFVAAASVEEVIEAVEYAHANALPFFILGGGSNIVIADEGFPGVVIALHLSDITSEARDGRVWVTVGAGVVWDEFVIWSIKEKLFGLECLSGVPGTVGGAVVANLGAYGAQVSDTFVHAEVLDTQAATTTVKLIPKEECHFSYHDSMFGHTNGRYIILRATFALSTDSSTQPSYRDNRFNMQALATELGHPPTQEEVRESVLTMREQKGSLRMPGRLSYNSAGSFFHMPFVSEEKYAEVVERARTLDVAKEERLRPWAWKQSDGSYKLAPGFLLEYTEFVKGYERAGAGISPRHTLSIINTGSATAAAIADLARAMQQAVKETFDVDIEREVEYIGAVEREN